MTRYTLMLFQQAYNTEQIYIQKFNKDNKISIACYLLNEDKTPHMLLFSGGNFENDDDINSTIQSLLDYEL